MHELTVLNDSPNLAPYRVVTTPKQMEISSKRAAMLRIVTET